MPRDNFKIEIPKHSKELERGMRKPWGNPL